MTKMVVDIQRRRRRKWRKKKRRKREKKRKKRKRKGIGDKEEKYQIKIFTNEFLQHQLVIIEW